MRAAGRRGNSVPYKVSASLAFARRLRPATNGGRLSDWQAVRCNALPDNALAWAITSKMSKRKVKSTARKSAGSQADSGSPESARIGSQPLSTLRQELDQID